MKRDFESRYQTGDVPWDHGTPDANFADMVLGRPIEPCQALDIGCGTGDNAIWLAQRGFEVTGCDISPTAINKAADKAAEAGVDCSFMVADFLDGPIPGAPFGLVIDRGCLHSVGGAEDLRRFAAGVAAHLTDDGLWLTLVGNADEPAREEGPPRLSAQELVAAVEPYCEIVSLVAGWFGGDQPDPPKAWICLLRKRDRPA